MSQHSNFLSLYDRLFFSPIDNEVEESSLTHRMDEDEYMQFQDELQYA